MELVKGIKDVKSTMDAKDQSFKWRKYLKIGRVFSGTHYITSLSPEEGPFCSFTCFYEPCLSKKQDKSLT